MKYFYRSTESKSSVLPIKSTTVKNVFGHASGFIAKVMLSTTVAPIKCCSTVALSATFAFTTACLILATSAFVIGLMCDKLNYQKSDSYATATRRSSGYDD